MENSELKNIWGQDDEMSLGHFNWDNLPQPEILNQENSEPESRGRFCDSQSQKKDKQALDSDQISELHLKKKNLCQFINNIGQLANEPITRDILRHCEKVVMGNYSNISADTIIKLTKNRVEKMIKNKRIKKNWSQEDIKILIWVVSKYCQMRGNTFSKEQIEQNDWEFIANLIPGVTPKNCMFKWLGLKKNNLAENCWTTEQSSLLNQLVKQHGLDKWGQISEELYDRNKNEKKIYRCPKQCREHWNCYLDPKLKKGPWQKKEDVLLLKSVKELEGAKKWAQIVKLFNGRTENALKNRFNLIIDKEYKQNRGKKKISEAQIIQNYLKKYESSVKLQQNQLVLLKQKKQLLAESRKNFKETAPSIKKQSKKSKKFFEDSEEYEPKQWLTPRKKTKTIKKQTKSQNFIHFQEPKLSSFDFHHQDNSYDNLFRAKKEEPIFQEESDLLKNCQQKIVNICQTHKKKGQRTTIQELGTNQQNFHIDFNTVNFVSIDQAAFQKLREQFTGLKQFFPCKVVNDKQIIKYSPQKQ